MSRIYRNELPDTPGLRIVRLNYDGTRPDETACATPTMDGGALVPFIDDDAGGTLYVLRQSHGVVGFVRARTFEDAWSIAEDCLLDDATPEEVSEAGRDYGDGDPFETDENGDPIGEDRNFPEGFGIRPNGTPGKGDDANPVAWDRTCTRTI